MSKAFTKEDGPPEPPVSRAPSEGRARVTAEGFRRLQAELEQLRADPAAQARSEQLAQRLLQLDVLPPPREGLRDRVHFGAHVLVEDEEGVRRRYQLVGPEELDAAEGRVSIESPLGRALEGRQVGDEVTVERPRGDVTFTVVGITYG